LGGREGKRYLCVGETFGDFGAWQAWQPAAAGDSRAPTPQRVGVRTGCDHKPFPSGSGAGRRHWERENTLSRSQAHTHTTSPTTSGCAPTLTVYPRTARRGSVTRSAWQAEPLPEPTSAPSSYRRAAAHRAALRRKRATFGGVSGCAAARKIRKKVLGNQRGLLQSQGYLCAKFKCCFVES